MNKRLCLLLLLLVGLARGLWAQDFRFEALKYPFEVQKITLPNQTEIAYTRQGKGKTTLLFIHGLGSYMPAWKNNLPALSKEYDCIALDLPGYGKSSKQHEISLAFYAETIAQFIDRLKLSGVVLVGHSMGGQIALTTALRYPDKLKRLILIAPAGFETFEAKEAQVLRNFTTPALIRATSEEQIRANLSKNFVQMPADANFMADDRILMRQALDFEVYCSAVSQCVAAMLQEPVANRLSEINIPVLVVFGEQDALIPNKFLHPILTTAQVADIGKRTLAKSHVVMIAQAGHFVQFEQAQAVHQAIRQFLAK